MKNMDMFGPDVVINCTDSERGKTKKKKKRKEKTTAKGNGNHPRLKNPASLDRLAFDFKLLSAPAPAPAVPVAVLTNEVVFPSARCAKLPPRTEPFI